jgi:hypothetical protein
MADVKSCSLRCVLVLVAALHLPAVKAESAATLDDPVAYCHAVGTIEADGHFSSSVGRAAQSI